MVEKEPMVVNACWDWGGGDFETALGGASHVGNREIANYLMDHGARKDIYCSAMLGDRDLVHAFIKTIPGIANVDGPHTFSLLYHVAISGDTKMAAMVKPHVIDLADYNQALHAAVRNGHASMTEWMLKNGVNDPNTKDFVGNTPLQNAEKKNYKEIADLLKKYDAK
jgi:ankyrin repeat protein